VQRSHDVREIHDPSTQIQRVTEARAVHRTPRVKRTHLVPFLLLLVAGCGSPADVAPDAVELDCPTTGRYMELSEGASWTYEVDDGGGIETKTQTVGPLEDVGGSKAGTMAFRLTTARGTGEVISWQEDTGTAVIRHREQDNAGTTTTDEFYAPFKTRIDESDAHVVEGATWDETYTETVTSDDGKGPVTTTNEKTERWLVEAVDETISVEAGDFCTLRVKKTSTVNGTGGSVKTYWFARGVGKVREEGGNQVEELAAYSN
jgi:hypothetical protein